MKDDSSTSKADKSSAERKTGFRFLDFVERVGNKLPDPVMLFAVGAFAVLIGSELAVRFGWEEDDPKVPTVAQQDQTEEEAAAVDSTPEPPAKIQAVSLLRRDGARWVWQNLVGNFTGFAPLGVVLVAMIGIGVAERSGLIGAILKCMIAFTPQMLITPSLVFVGVMSSMALDAGYVVLPPLAAVIFARMGRAPLVGIAAVFAGVSAGFSANLLITGLDPLLQGFTQTSAAFYDKEYVVDIRCNYYFMIASVFMITLAGWAVTALIVEPRFTMKQIKDQISAGEAGSGVATEQEQESPHLTSLEGKGLIWAAGALVIALGFLLSLILVDDWPLNGTPEGAPFPTWVSAIVPMLFVLFLVPGIAFGIAVGTIKRDRDIADMMGKTMAGMGSYIILAFFAGQFTAWFGHSNLGTLIAISGVDFLKQFNLPPSLLVVAIILLTGFLNLFIGSASGKWALIAPVFVPLFMGLGISPELTQGAYRIGDSVTNTIAPLNPYVIIVLVFIRRYAPKAGLGSLVSLMLPYTIWFGILWTVMLLIWVMIGAPLGPDGAELIFETK